MYWFEGALKPKLGGGGSCKIFLEIIKKSPPPLTIKINGPLVNCSLILMTITILHQIGYLLSCLLVGDGKFPMAS